MSRIGRAPITVPAGVDIHVDGDNHITVKGPKGTLERTLPSQIQIETEAAQGHTLLHVKRPNDEGKNPALHGLTRTLVHNMVVGVTEGFSKTLEIQGVGYRATKEGKNLVMNLGYSHQVIVPETEDIQIEVPDANHVVIKGIDKQKVGQVCCGHPEQAAPGNPTRARGFATRAKWSASKKARPARNKEGA